MSGKAGQDGSGSHGRPRVLKALGSSMAARLGMAAVNFGLFWMLSHHLGAEALGGFSLLMGLMLTLQSLPLLGLSLPHTRRIATEAGGHRREVSNALAFALPVALLFAVALGLAGQYFYPPWLHLPFWLVAAAIVPSAWTSVAETTLFGLERASEVAHVQFAEAVLRCVLAAWAVMHGGGLVGVFCVVLALRLLTALRYLLLASVPRPAWRELSRELQRRNFHEVPVYFGIALIAALTSRLDLVLLSRLGDLHEVGRYAAASRLYEAALMLPTLAAMVLMPTLARMFSQQPGQFGDTLRLALRTSLAVGMALALVVAALSGPLIDLLYPPEFADAAPVLRWLIFAAVWVTADQTLSSTMIAAHAQTHDLRTMMLALVLLAVGLLALVPAFGPVGAAAAVTFALIGRVLWRIRWAARRLALPGLWTDLARVCGATTVGIAGLLAGLLLHGAVAALIGGLVAYAVTARATGLFGAHPVDELRTGLARLVSRAG